MRSKMQSTLEKNMQLTGQQTMDEAVNEFQRYMKTLSLPIDIMCRRNEFKKIDENYDETSIFTVPYMNEDGIMVFTASQDLKAGDSKVGVVAMDISAAALEEYINPLISLY